MTSVARVRFAWGADQPIAPQRFNKTSSDAAAGVRRYSSRTHQVMRMSCPIGVLRALCDRLTVLPLLLRRLRLSIRRELSLKDWRSPGSFFVSLRQLTLDADAGLMAPILRCLQFGSKVDAVAIVIGIDAHSSFVVESRMYDLSDARVRLPAGTILATNLVDLMHPSMRGDFHTCDADGCITSAPSVVN